MAALPIFISTRLPADPEGVFEFDAVWGFVRKSPMDHPFERCVKDIHKRCILPDKGFEITRRCVFPL